MAPVVIFVYNRLEHTKTTIVELQKNELASDSDVYIFSDAAKNNSAESAVKDVRDYIKNVSGFKSVTLFLAEKNKGLANSVIDGVTKIINQHSKVIVLEDDLVTSPYFLRFMNDSLKYFEDCSNVFSITGYAPPIDIPKDFNNHIYLSFRSSSWGWATWQNRWEKIDWCIANFNKISKEEKTLFNRGGNDLYDMLSLQMKGLVDSWAIRWSYAHCKNTAFTIIPVKSYVNNIGIDSSGVHCKKSYASKYEVDLVQNYKQNCLSTIDQEEGKNIQLQKNVKKFYDYTLARFVKVKLRLLIKKKFRI